MSCLSHQTRTHTITVLVYTTCPTSDMISNTETKSSNPVLTEAGMMKDMMKDMMINVTMGKMMMARGGMW